MIIWTYTRQTFIDFFLAQRILLLIFYCLEKVTVWLCHCGTWKRRTVVLQNGKALQATCLLLHGLYVVTYDQCFITVEGAIEVFKNWTSLCDILKNANISYHFIKGLGGDPEWFLWSIVNMKCGFLSIFLWLKGSDFCFFDVTQWRTVQIWGDLPVSSVLQ